MTFLCQNAITKSVLFLNIGLTPPFNNQTAQSVERDIPNLTHKWWSPILFRKSISRSLKTNTKMLTSVIFRRDGSAPLHDHKCWTGGSESTSSSSSSSTSSSPLSPPPPSSSSPFPSSVVSTCSPPTSQISWIRLADYRILTNGLLTFTTDDRLPQNIFEHSIIYNLKISCIPSSELCGSEWTKPA